MDVNDPLPPVEDAETPLGLEPVAAVSSEGGEPADLQQITGIPGSNGALAALDTRGLVWLIGEDGGVREDPILDLRDAGGGFEVFGPESGLRSVAFHPDFAAEGTDGFGKLYVAYSASAEDVPEGTRLFETGGPAAEFHDVYAEVTVADPSDPVADPETERELFRVEQPFGNHNAGQLNFNPEAAPGDPDYGMLYVAVADGGGANDPLDAAGDTGSIYGKLLRIDPLGGPDGAAYGVPADNPLVSDPDALGEVWAHGFRNPQQFSFDEGLIYASDIGQSTIEEINVVIPGADHGWDDREGALVNDDGAMGPLPEADPADLQYPLTQYDHEEITTGNAAVGGGFVYRGDAVPELEGSYVFTNFPTGDLFAAPLEGLSEALEDGRIDPSETREPVRLNVLGEDGEPVDFVADNGSGRADLRLGLDADGEILAFSKQTGEIVRLTSGDEEAEAPAEPMAPSEPQEPQQPPEPEGPTEPEKPAAPEEPVVSEGPGEPQEPTPPMEPEAPMEPPEQGPQEPPEAPEPEAPSEPILGTEDEDVLVGTEGDDVITTGDAIDRIEIGTAGFGDVGSDVVTDFDVDGGDNEKDFDFLSFTLAGADLEVSARADFVALVAALRSDGDDATGASVEGTDLVLAFGGGDAVRLADIVKGNDLTLEDLSLA